MAGALVAGGDEQPAAVTSAAAPLPPGPAATVPPAPAATPIAAPVSAPVPAPAAVPTPLPPDTDEYEDESAMYPYASPELPSGTWFVVLGGARGAPDARMVAAERRLQDNGVNVRRIVSDDYPNLNPGMAVLVEGPTTRATAQARLRVLRGLVPDAYAKAGW